MNTHRSVLLTRAGAQSFNGQPGERRCDLLPFFVLMVGLSLIAAPAGIIAAALTEARKLMARD